MAEAGVLPLLGWSLLAFLVLDTGIGGFKRRSHRPAVHQKAE
ncbi:hypothetical protein [Arthrobacter sp. B2a2-09]|nr:hypothetical protein [Arthrobacter sp. B2a2-09]